MKCVLLLALKAESLTTYRVLLIRVRCQKNFGWQISQTQRLEELSFLRAVTTSLHDVTCLLIFQKRNTCKGKWIASKVLVFWKKLPSTEGRWIKTLDKTQSKQLWAWTVNWQWFSQGIAPRSLLPRWLLNWSLYLFMRFATATILISQDLALPSHSGCGCCTENGCQLLCGGSVDLQLSAECHHVPWWECVSLP